MEHKTLYRFEVKDPHTTTQWRPLWEITEDQLVKAQELKDELNKINAPVQVRIVREDDQDAKELPWPDENESKD